MATQWRCAFLLCLVLSNIGPGAAERIRQSANLHAEGSARAGESQEWKSSYWCPDGLRKNETAELCFFDGEFDSHDPDDKFEDIWSDESGGTYGSDFPIVFKPTRYAGVFRLQAQFSAELAKAMGHRGVLEDVVGDVAQLEAKRNMSFKEKFNHVLESVKQLGENVKPGEFLVVHAGLHGVLEMIVLSMHGLEHLAEIGLHGGFLLTEGIIEGSFWVGLGIGAHEVAAVVPIIGWALLAPMAIMDAFVAHRHYKHKTHHAKEFARKLVMKSDCMEERIDVHRLPSVGNIEGGLFTRENVIKPVVTEVCGNHTTRMLRTQVQRTNAAMRNFFSTVEEVGRCLWSHGSRRWSKTNCAEAVYMPLREDGKKPGILFEALAFAHTYGMNADEVLVEPIYGDWFKRVFGLELPHNDTLVGMLDSLKDDVIEHRIMGCMSILASHRAFERMFKRITTAMRVWMQSFARDLRHIDIRASMYPCRRVFYGIKDLGKGMCKSEQWYEGHGIEKHEIDESSPCLQMTMMSFQGSDADKTIWPEAHSEE